jgi:hypothetical protein
MGLFAVDGEKFPRRQSTRCLGSGAHQLFSSGSSLLSIDLQCGVRHSQRRKTFFSFRFVRVTTLAMSAVLPT